MTSAWLGVVKTWAIFVLYLHTGQGQARAVSVIASLGTYLHEKRVWSDISVGVISPVTLK